MKYVLVTLYFQVCFQSPIWKSFLKGSLRIAGGIKASLIRFIDDLESTSDRKVLSKERSCIRTDCNRPEILLIRSIGSPNSLLEPLFMPRSVPREDGSR